MLGQHSGSLAADCWMKQRRTARREDHFPSGAFDGPEVDAAEVVAAEVVADAFTGAEAERAHSSDSSSTKPSGQGGSSTVAAGRGT